MHLKEKMERSYTNFPGSSQDRVFGGVQENVDKSVFKSNRTNEFKRGKRHYQSRLNSTNNLLISRI